MRLIQSKDPCIKAKMEDLVDHPVIVRVGDIDDESMKDFFTDMQKAFSSPQPVVPIVIDSCGGSAYTLMAMVDIIRSSPKPVSTVVVGKAMSAGGALLSFGTKGYRYVAPAATLMIHEVSGWSGGKVEEVKADAQEIERLNQTVFKMMAKNCGQKPNYFLEKIHQKSHAEWYLTANQVLRERLADHVGVPTLSVRIEAKFDYSV